MAEVHNAMITFESFDINYYNDYKEKNVVSYNFSFNNLVVKMM